MASAKLAGKMQGGYRKRASTDTKKPSREAAHDFFSFRPPRLAHRTARQK